MTAAIISAIKTHPRPAWVRGGDERQWPESNKSKLDSGEGRRLLRIARAATAQRLWSAFCEWEQRVSAAVSPFSLLPQPKGDTSEERDRDSRRLYEEDIAARTKAVYVAWQALKAVRDEAEAVLDERTFAAFDALYRECDTAFREVWAARLSGDHREIARATGVALKKLERIKSQRAEALKMIRRLTDPEGL